MTIKGIIFDFDGLIIDTETPDVTVWKEFYQPYRLEFPMEEYSKQIGQVFDDTFPIEYLIRTLGLRLDGAALYEQFKALRLSLIEEQPLRAGVLDYLQQAKARGLAIGLASSSKASWVNHHIARENIQHYFQCIRTLEDVSHPKPDPELYVRTLECLGLQPHEAIAFEDSFNGIRAAKSAGMNAVAVPNPVTKIFDFSQADLVLNELTETSLEKLIAHFELI